jgi:chromosome segregation ATPase
MSNDDLMKQLQDTAAELSRYKTRSEKAEQKVRTLSAEAKSVTRLNDEIQYLQGELDKLTGEVSFLADQNRTLQAEARDGVRKLASKVEVLEKELETARALSAEFEHKLVVAHAEKVALVEHATQARAELRDFKEAVRELLAQR